MHKTGQFNQVSGQAWLGSLSKSLYKVRQSQEAILTMSHQTLQVSLDARGVLTVTLNRPEIRNAFNEIVIEELAKVFSHDAVQPGVKIVVLRGNGPVF